MVFANPPGDVLYMWILLITVLCIYMCPLLGPFYRHSVYGRRKPDVRQVNPVNHLSHAAKRMRGCPYH